MIPKQLMESKLITDEEWEEYQRLKRNWNELREHIGKEWYSYDGDSIEFEVSKDILNKMEELEKGASDE